MSTEFGYLDRAAKKEIRRCALKALAIPGHQVPYASREMPIGRGFGTGGLQLTLALIGAGDTVKVIDQGADDTTNAVSQYLDRKNDIKTILLGNVFEHVFPEPSP